MYKEILIETEADECLVNITGQIQEIIKESGVNAGICVVFVPHTTAAVTINSALDNATLKDIIVEIRRLIPTRVDFNHIFDTPSDAAGHIKSTLVGSTLSVIIHEGKPLLGNSQSVMFFEFDGPRKRRVFLQILGEK